MRAYAVQEQEEYDCGSFGYVIADNSREARKIAWRSHPDVHSSFDGEYIRMRVKWIRKANIEGLSKGWYDWDEDALRRGIVDWLSDCDIVCECCCFESSTVTFDYSGVLKKDAVLCEDCHADNCEAIENHAVHFGKSEVLRGS
jgi:hypothetical protein